VRFSAGSSQGGGTSAEADQGRTVQWPSVTRPAYFAGRLQQKKNRRGSLPAERGDELQQEPGNSNMSSQDENVSPSPSLTLTKAIPIASNIKVRPKDCRGRPLPSSLRGYQSGLLVCYPTGAAARQNQGRITSCYRGKDSDRDQL
jgi:hypothetical protein